MSTPANNVNPNSTSTGWLSWIWGGKRSQTAVVPEQMPPATTILVVQPPPASPLAPVATGGDSSPECVDEPDTLLRRHAEPQDLSAALPPSGPQSPVSPDGHSKWHSVGTILGLDSCVSPQKGEGENFSHRPGCGSVRFSAGGSAQEAAAASVGLEHPPSETTAAPDEIKKDNFSDHDKKMIRYRSYILVTSAVISTLGLGFYLLWSKRSQDGSFDFTGISNAPHLCTDFLKSFVGIKICPLSTEIGFGDCSTDLAPPPKAR